MIVISAVSKIYKPELRWRAAKNVLAEALKESRQRGAEVPIAVGEDKIAGNSSDDDFERRGRRRPGGKKRAVENIVDRFVQIKREIRRAKSHSQIGFADFF